MKTFLPALDYAGLYIWIWFMLLNEIQSLSSLKVFKVSEVTEVSKSLKCLKSRILLSFFHWIEIFITRGHFLNTGRIYHGKTTQVVIYWQWKWQQLLPRYFPVITFYFLFFNEISLSYKSKIFYMLEMILLLEMLLLFYILSEMSVSVSLSHIGFITHDFLSVY